MIEMCAIIPLPYHVMKFSLTKKKRRMAEDTAPELCAVCLEAIGNDAHPTCVLPGCGHTFHVACMITCAQYDVRCPVCRRIPTGVECKRCFVPPANVTVIDLDADEDDDDAETVLWRRYNARRRRLMRTHPHIARRVDSLRDLRKEMNRKMKDVERIYNQRIRDIWRDDPAIQQLKRELSLARRRELRLERTLEREIEPLVSSHRT